MLTEEAKKDLFELDKISQKKIKKSFSLIQIKGINAVNAKQIDKSLFEVKTSNIRALYTYIEGQIIVVAVIFIKKTQKTPGKYINRAKKILEI